MLQSVYFMIKTPLFEQQSTVLLVISQWFSHIYIYTWDVCIYIYVYYMLDTVYNGDCHIFSPFFVDGLNY